MGKSEKTVIHKGQKPTPEQIAEIKKAAMKKFITDEDAPELTLEQYAEMAEFSNAKRFQSIWVQYGSASKNYSRFAVFFACAKKGRYLLNLINNLPVFRRKTITIRNTIDQFRKI